LRFYERLKRKWFATKRKKSSLERTRIGRFNVRRLSVALAPHPSPLPRERELVTVALAPHPSPLPRERELVTGKRSLCKTDFSSR
jgi:hypothetical protein